MAVARGAAGLAAPKGVPLGKVDKFGTLRIAPKMEPLSVTEAAVLILSMCAGAFKVK